MLPKETESCWNMAPDRNLLCPPLFVPLDLWKSLFAGLLNSLGTYRYAPPPAPKVFLYQWTERVVNRIYVAVVEHEETINGREIKWNQQL